ncbi:chaperone modulator CbpM [Methylophaga sp.]|uniref:chaperone modulator CbpM n=1 Tax=Methylophaga sp. TaxID=2024840 RepID=UPI0013FF7869|nr:chaperone modulator CbpM [Methylophaga sp.]MTI64777.1 MerR family transcriptional regulator [Methylophaga sp.]
MQSNTDLYQLNSHLISFTQICDCCELPATTLAEMLDYGVIAPSAMTITEHEALYEAECIQKVRKAARLCRDLEVNIAGAALALDLLDEINTLRERLLIVE